MFIASIVETLNESNGKLNIGEWKLKFADENEEYSEQPLEHKLLTDAMNVVYVFSPGPSIGS